MPAGKGYTTAGVKSATSAKARKISNPKHNVKKQGGPKGDTPLSKLPEAVRKLKKENTRLAKKAAKGAIKSSSKKRPPAGPVKNMAELRARAKAFGEKGVLTDRDIKRAK